MMPTAKWTLFPAEVTLSPELVERYNVPGWREVAVQVDTTGGVWVFAWDGEHNQPSVLAIGTVPDGQVLPGPLTPRYASTWTADVEPTGSMTIQRGHGCGCRNPLRNADVLATMTWTSS